MGETTFSQVVSRTVHDLMEDSEWAQVIFDYYRKLESEYYDSDYVDFFIQKGGWMNHKWTMQDAYTFACLHSDLASGKLISCDLSIGVEPSKDCLIDSNREKLREHLPRMIYTSSGVDRPTITADVWGGTQDEDGFLKWSPYLVFQSFTDGVPSKTIKIKARNIPLEIGSQSGEKTLMQTRTFGLARWPYGSKTIRVFVPTMNYVEFPYE